MRIIPVLMSGGSGTRLWPLSRQARPKQFLVLEGERSLFQKTVARTSGRAGAHEFAPPLILTGQAHIPLVEAQLDEMDVEPLAVLLEPEARDTAAAIAAACAYLVAHGHGEDVVLVSPCDHAVRDEDAFRRSVSQAAEAARGGDLVIFGMSPDHPATGYGYIKCGKDDGAPGRPVEAFHEKPDRERAEQFLEEGGFLWNAGIFVFTAAAGLGALKRHAPAIAEAAIEAVASGTPESKRLMLEAEVFAKAPRQPFDVAVMEKARGARVIPADWGWSDVGSWSAVHAVSRTDEQGNAVAGDVVLEDCRGVLARGEGVSVTALGVSDLVIVATGDAVFVAPRSRSEELKRIVSRLEADGRDELL